MVTSTQWALKLIFYFLKLGAVICTVGFGCVAYAINTLPSHKRLAKINEGIKRCMFCCARFWYRSFYYTQHVLSNMLSKF